MSVAFAEAQPDRRTRFGELARRASSALAFVRGRPKRRQFALAVVAAAVAAVAFARVAEDYLTNDPLARWDVNFAHWLAGERDGAATDFFRVVTLLGSPAATLVIGTVACVFLYRRRHLAEAVLLPLVLGGAELLNLVLKIAFHRERPEIASVHLDTYSFPSGHAMISTAAYGAFAIFLCRRAGTRARCTLIAAATAAFVALVCFSRLYLGVHYLSDVLAGVAGGAFALAGALALDAVYGDRFATRLAGSSIDKLARRLTRS